MSEIDIIVKFVPESEYKKLVDENFNLRNRLTELYRNEEKHKEIIRQNEVTIQQLRDENQMLRQKITELENIIVKLDTKINLMEEKEQFNKYVVAIQDVNRLEQIETKLSGNDKKNLIKLRRSRVTECHYIEEDYDEDEIKDRRTVLYERLQNMSPEVRSRFERMFPGLLKSIMGYIIQTKTQPSEDSMKYILDWWE
jgi:hypothetical protein